VSHPETIAAGADRPLAVAARRRALGLANGNGALWAAGNGLISTMSIVYLAMEFDVPRMGLGISLILAAPHLAGLLRLGAPPLIDRLVDRKRFCLAAYLLSAVVLAGVPWVAAPGRLPSAAFALGALVGLWCAYQVLEYLGSVALWSWLADLAPVRIRGRFLGRRERWMQAGQAVGMAAGGWLLWQWQRTWPASPRWIAYAVTAGAGAALMLAALAPLALIPRAVAGPAARRRLPLAALLAPLADARFLRLLLFGCCWSLTNGLIESPQKMFPKWVLGLELFVLLWLNTGLRLGQMAISPWVGRLLDRWGNRPVLIGSTLLVAQAPAFFFLANPGQPWWIVGAWVMWIAWVGLNIGQPNLMLKLAPQRANTPYIAVWFTLTGLSVAAGMILGGMLMDRYSGATFLWFGRFPLDWYKTAFLAGWIARSAAVLLLFLVVEPGRFTRPSRA
jgi:MFS family permease